MVVSALLTRDVASPPSRILHLARAGAITVLLSEELLAEYREVLLRERIQRRHGRSADEIDAVLAELRESAHMVSPLAAPAEGPDPDDEHLWRLVGAHSLALLITGDQALVETPPAWASVLTPRRWLQACGLLASGVAADEADQ